MVKSAAKSAVAAALRSGGAAVGASFGGPTGAVIGRKIGAGISKVIGSGDYKIEENSVVSGSVPAFAGNGRTIRIAHREYLGDVSGSIGFTNTSFPLNPGQGATFPWLASMANNYQCYRFRGLLFEFVSMSSDALNSVNTALGTVIMGTQYDVGAPAFTSKFEMENYEFSGSSRPSRSFLHPVECAKEDGSMIKYIRTGAYRDQSDPRMYDWGVFQLATVGMQAEAVIGELWVTYDLEFLKPRISPGLSPGLFTHIKNGAFDTNDRLGLIQTAPEGTLGATVVAAGGYWRAINIPAQYSAGRFLITMIWRSTTASAITQTNPVLTNLTLQPKFALNALSSQFAPQNGESSKVNQLTFVVTIDGYNADGSLITLSGSFTPGTAPYLTVDIYIVALPLSDSTY